MTTAIIGAGIAGLSAARSLKAAGGQPVLFDKGRGPGGRMSTRRAETPLGQLRWDHGAQFFTARTQAFQSEVVALRKAGAIGAWQPRLADIKRQGDGWTVGVRPADACSEPLFVGTPSMNAVVKALASGLDIEWGRRVSGITVDVGAKWLTFEDGVRAGPFARVICAVPGEQAALLLEGASSRLAAEAAQASSAPCWAVMLAFDAPVPVFWDGANLSGGALSWAARNCAKPGRGPGETWVLHASADWSRVNADLPAEAVSEALVSEFRDISKAPVPAYCSSHRWLYAKVEQAAGQPFGWDASAGIAAIGDWRTGPRVEQAWASGRACAEFLAGTREQLEIQEKSR